MMNATDFMQFQAQAFKATHAMAARSIEGMQKLADLNMKTAKTTLEASAEQVKTLLSAKDAQALTDMLSANSKPNAQFATYAQDVYAIASETSADVAQMVEKQIEDGNKQMFDAVDALAKNAPAGSEGAVAFVKQYLTASRSAFDQVSNVGKQVVEMAEANIAGVSEAANGGKAKAKAKKAAR